MNTLIEVPVHTIFLLVGPSAAGKSEFSLALKESLMRVGYNSGIEYKVSIISSDALRTSLLGGSVEPYSPQMQEASDQAFGLLYTTLKSVTTYPINHEFVIVDTTGLSPKFRDDVRAIGEANQYVVHVVFFDYSEAEAARGTTSEARKNLSRQQVIRIRRHVKSDLQQNKYFGKTTFHKRSEAHWRDVGVEVTNAYLYSRCQVKLQPYETLAVVGDVHEMAGELKALTQSFPRNTRLVLAGDYLDKGRNTEETLLLVHKLATENGALIVVGNHERYVQQRLMGKAPSNPELEKIYFTSLEVLEKKADLSSIFFNLYNNYTVPFVHVFSPDSRSVYVTHVPCEEKYIGKLSPVARAKQRNLYIADREADVRESYKFIFDEAKPFHPLHCFGHFSYMPNERAAIFKKTKVFLDTGAVSGGWLTAMTVKGDVVDFLYQKSSSNVTGDVLPAAHEITQPPAKPEGEFDINSYDLSPHEKAFVNRFPRTGARYISSTMSPAEASVDSLESIKTAFKYYADLGVARVVMEIKHMGSRCQLYLFKDGSHEDFAVSRRGYVITEDRCPGITKLIEERKEILLDGVSEHLGIDANEIIVDGELLPWSALGESIIKRDFISYSALIRSEIAEVQSSGLAKFPQFFLDFKEKREDIDCFDETLSLYSKSVNVNQGLDYQPFDVLYADGTEQLAITPEGERFSSVNDGDFWVFDPSSESDVEKAEKQFYKLVVADGFEGVVVKPDNRAALSPDAAPYLKVRGEDYLQLVYGYDYGSRLPQLLKQKSNKHKIRLSCKEHAIGRKMLASKDPVELKQNVIRMIGELKKESMLDPRL